MDPTLKYCYAYPRPAVTTDCVVFSYFDSRLHVLLIQRGAAPFIGEWAFPGGFLNMDECALEGAQRELLEETGYTVSNLNFLGKCIPMPGKVMNSLSLFQAKVLSTTSSQNLDLEEAGLKAKWFNLDDFIRGVHAGDYKTSMTTLGAILLADRSFC